MRNSSTSDFLLTSQVARLLGVSAQTVRVYERKGRLPAIKTASGVSLFAPADVERLRLEREAERREPLPAAG